LGKQQQQNTHITTEGILMISPDCHSNNSQESYSDVWEKIEQEAPPCPNELHYTLTPTALMKMSMKSLEFDVGGLVHLDRPLARSAVVIGNVVAASSPHKLPHQSFSDPQHRIMMYHVRAVAASGGRASVSSVSVACHPLGLQ
jgi:hypothetical protein